jgi:hypothetical protein
MRNSAPYQGREFAGGRSSYRSRYYNGGNGHGGRYGHDGGYGHDGRRGHDHDGHRHPYGGYSTYAYGYPGWYGYPYYGYPFVIDPGFYDWGTPDDSENGQGATPYAPSGQDSAYAGEPSYYPPTDAAPYNEQDSPQPPRPPASADRAEIQEYHFAGPSTATAPVDQPLKVIFKDNRAPVMMQNYMINSSALTDLDRDHYEKIPLDEIDVAATEQANRSRGIDFQVPGTSRY